MSILAVNPAEIQQVESRVDSARADLKKVPVPSSPTTAAFGFPDLTSACGALVKDEKERLRGAGDWCEETIDALRFTSQHVNDTDRQVAHEFAKKSSLDEIDEIVALCVGRSPWDVVFSWEPDRYQ